MNLRMLTSPFLLRIENPVSVFWSEAPYKSLASIESMYVALFPLIFSNLSFRKGQNKYCQESSYTLGLLFVLLCQTISQYLQNFRRGLYKHQ